MLLELRVWSLFDSAIEAFVGFTQETISYYQDKVARLRSHIKQLRIQIQQKSSRAANVSDGSAGSTAFRKRLIVSKDQNLRKVSEAKTDVDQLLFVRFLYDFPAIVCCVHGIEARALGCGISTGMIWKSSPSFLYRRTCGLCAKVT